MKKCPIPGCNYVYQRGIAGWHRHVSHPSTHPYWHQDATAVKERIALFQLEYPEFFPPKPEPKEAETSEQRKKDSYVRPLSAPKIERDIMALHELVLELEERIRGSGAKRVS